MYVLKEVLLFITGYIACPITAYIYYEYIDKKNKKKETPEEENTKELDRITKEIEEEAKSVRRSKKPNISDKK